MRRSEGQGHRRLCRHVHVFSHRVLCTKQVIKRAVLPWAVGRWATPETTSCNYTGVHLHFLSSLLISGSAGKWAEERVSLDFPATGESFDAKKKPEDTGWRACFSQPYLCVS